MQMQELGMSSEKRVRPLTEAEIAEVVGSMSLYHAWNSAIAIQGQTGFEIEIVGEGGGDDWEVRTDSGSSKIIVFKGSSS